MFPKARLRFQELVNQRGAQLRSLSLEELEQVGLQPTEHITVESRPSTISILVQPQADGSLRVVVQGFMEAKHLPGKHVAIDGFYKHPDGRITAMDPEEFYEFD